MLGVEGIENDYLMGKGFLLGGWKGNVLELVVMAIHVNRIKSTGLYTLKWFKR